MKTLHDLILAFGLMTFLVPASFGQKADKLLKIKTEIMNESGAPLSGAVVSVAGSPNAVISNSKGFISIEALSSDILVVESDGYHTKYIQPSEIKNDKIVLTKEVIGFEEKKKLELPYRKVYSNNMLGAASMISDNDLDGKNDLNLTGSLKGMASGLYISETPGVHRESGYDICIRGLNTRSAGNATPLIIIDGVERPLGYLQAEDVESITVLKDAVAKSFYKGKAANGVLLVKTKRGKLFQNKRRINVETGLSTPTSLPEFLNSAEYAEKYNLARRNSGLTNLYSEADITGYRNPGIKYPSNNYYGLLLKDSKSYTKVTSTFSGGSDKLQYFLSAGYLHDGGLEAVGYSNALDQFSVRSNLDYKINSSVNAFLDIYGFVDDNNTNYLQTNDLFSRMSSQRPNEYTVKLKDNADPDSVIYGSGRYGTSSDYQNLYAEMLLGGSRKNTNRVGQTNMGFNFDFSSLLKGLSSRICLTFDTYNYVSVGKNDNFYSYLPTWENDSLARTTLITVGKKNSGMSTLDSDGYKRYSLLGQINYLNRFGDHYFNGSMVFFGDQTEYMYDNYVNKSQSNTLLLNYSFKDKWIAELDLGLLGSSKLSDENRYGFFPAAGIGWIISKEDFLSEVNGLDYLKLKASYGISGTDDDLNYFAYQTRWNNSGKTYFGTAAATLALTSRRVSYATPSIDWEKSAELNIGVEMLFLKDFSLNLDYYNVLRSNIPIYMEDITNQTSGLYNQQINYAKIRNNGVDATLGYGKKMSNWYIHANLNANYSFSKYVKSTSWADVPLNRNYDGKATDAYIGLVSSGIIKSQEELEATSQSYGEIGIGDLKYANLNSDNIVDQNDVKEIGNSFPRIHYGLNITVSYKNLGLAVSGYGAALYDIYRSNSYFRPMPETAYSVIANEAYNPETGLGTFPRLTTTNSSNNYRLSDFWLADGSFFKIKDVELSYTLASSISHSINLNKIRLFVKGNNLLTLSGFGNLDPECINAGLTSYPFMRTFTAGCNLTF